MDWKYFFCESEGSSLANSTNCCSLTGQKRAFDPLLLKNELIKRTKMEQSQNAYSQSFQFSSDVDWNWCIYSKIYKTR